MLDADPFAPQQSAEPDRRGPTTSLTNSTTILLNPSAGPSTATPMTTVTPANATPVAAATIVTAIAAMTHLPARSISKQSCRRPASNDCPSFPRCTRSANCAARVHPTGKHRKKQATTADLNRHRCSRRDYRSPRLAHINSLSQSGWRQLHRRHLRTNSNSSSQYPTRHDQALRTERLLKCSQESTNSPLGRKNLSILLPGRCR